MTNIWKKEPKNDWLIDLEKYRIKEKPGPHLHLGPWFSDNGEDGVIDYLFDYINDINKFAVDIGSAHGYGGSQVRHIADKYNWDTLEMDGIGKWIPMHQRVKIEWITKYNICELLEKYKTPIEFDLLSIDIDSMDYWVLESLLVGGYRPNLAIIEYNPIFSCNEAYVINHNLNYRKDATSRYGASLKAYEVLMNKYEYTLIHVFGKIGDSVQANNCLFLHNKYINDNMQIKTISELHPFEWKETYKNKNSKLSLSEIKDELIQKYFIKLL